ncbi:hypothetical protein VTI74DRAFT_3804 [Chaetomium olivicolor]
MAEHGLSHNQLTNLLTALASIDRRLCRIETALRITNSTNPNPAIPNASTPFPANSPATGPQVQVGPALAQPPQQPQHQHQQTPGIVNSNPIPGSTTTNPALTLTPLEPPPQGFTITSRATMQDELDQFTIPRGYSMRIAGAKVTGKRKVRWVCFRGGEARHHRGPVDESLVLKAKAEGRRKPTTDRQSKKCGCMFKFEVVETARDSDVWVLHYPNEEHKVHNHGPSDTMSDPRARKLPGYMLVEVDAWLKEGWLVSRIQEELRSRGFMNVLNTDLYNRKRLLRKEGQLGEAAAAS